MPNQISDESLVGILEAFLALYGPQKAKRTPRDQFYLTNLPPDEAIAGKRAREVECEDVRQVVEKTIHALRNPTSQRWKPIFAARNLFFVIDETEFPRVEKLNEALQTYWPILWRVCARGHYFHNSKSLVDEPPGKEVYDPFVDPPLPAFEESECRLILPRAKYGGFGLLLKLPGKLAPTVPMYEFVIISEFRAMMERFDAEREESFWRGYYLSAYTKKLETGEVVVTFRFNENGIMFDLERGSWQAFRNLLHRAWKHPEVRRLWDDAVLRYGETKFGFRR